MSNVRMVRSTPAVAIMVERYLFQSWVRASAGGAAPAPPRGILPGREWRGRVRTRWFEADAGVRRSKTRRRESELTEEIIVGECGEKEAL